jgi:hypothetical protein
MDRRELLLTTLMALHMERLEFIRYTTKEDGIKPPADALPWWEQRDRLCSLTTAQLEEEAKEWEEADG